MRWDCNEENVCYKNANDESRRRFSFKKNVHLPLVFLVIWTQQE
jgi:hypothetical protein